MVRVEEAPTIVRAPRWHRTLYASFLAFCIALSGILLLAVHNPFASFFGAMTLVLAVAFLPVAASAFLRRLELTAGNLLSVRVTGRKVCAVSDISKLQLSGSGRGLSRCSVVRRDGQFAFGSGGPVWRTADLIVLAKAMGVSVESDGQSA